MKRAFDLEQFLLRYFTANQCEVVAEKAGVLNVKLTKKLDMALMNRPFYWQYMESIRQSGEPLQITFITDMKHRKEDGEWIHFGMPRLSQIYGHLQQSSQFIRLFEKLQVDINTLLQPWLVVNCIIVYKGKQLKEELLTIGLNLINGKMVLEMMDKLVNISLAPVISAHCFTISPLIKLESGFRRIEQFLNHHIMNQDQTWAHENINLLEQEIKMLKHFYEREKSSTEIDKEIIDLQKRLTPTISYKILNGGLFYLSKNFAT